MSDEVRIEARIRNNVLWRAIHDTHKNVAQWCRAMGLCQTYVGAYLNLKRSPYGKNGPLPSAVSMSEATGIGVEELFPRALYGLEVVEMVSEVPLAEHLLGTSVTPRLEAPIHDQDLRDILDDIMDPGRDVLSGYAGSILNSREAEVVRQRFGLDGSEPKLYKEIGENVGVSSSYVQQVERRALRKMRHPSNSKRVKPFLDDIGAER